MSELLDPMRNPVTYAVPFFLLSIGMELAALRWLDHDDQLTGYLRKDATTSILMGLGSLVALTVFKVGTFFVYTAVYVHAALWRPATDTAWYWLALMVGLDLAYYFQHRFVHRVRIGWAAHQAHHSSEYMNFSTALRQKWNPWFEFFFWLPLPFLGFAPWTLYVAFSFNLVYQFFVHTELVAKLPRPVELVFNTPSHHRVHHSSEPEYLDRNFGGILIVWDRLLGTFAEETHRPSYGLTKPVGTYHLLALQYGAYGEMVRQVRQARCWRHRLGYVLGPPGWRPQDEAASAADTRWL